MTSPQETHWKNGRSPASSHKLRVLVPIAASGMIVLTLIICFILVKTRHIYVGGLDWPFFSDMGRDKPGYYVFCVGLTISAVLIAWTYVINYQFQFSVLQNPIITAAVSPRLKRVALLVMVCGVVSVIGLPILSIFSTADYPSLHANSAYAFFILQTIAVIINTIVSYKLMRAVMTTGSAVTPLGGDSGVEKHNSFRRTLCIQLVFGALFLVAFILYIPVGLALAPDTPRLSIDECLDKDLGDKYCTDTVVLNSTYTKLWTYEDNKTNPQMRAASQLGCILTLVGYSATFASHKFSLMDEARRHSNA